VFNDIVGFAIALPGRIIDALVNLPGMLFDLGFRAMHAILDAFIQVAGDVIGWASGFPQEVVNTLLGLESALWGIGMQAMQGLWNGLKSLADDVKDWVGDFAKSMVKKITDPLGIFSPSRVMAWVGEMMMAGLAQGLEDSLTVAVNAGADSGVAVAQSVTKHALNGAPKVAREGWWPGAVGAPIVVDTTIELDGMVVARNTAKHMNRTGGPQLRPNVIAN